MRKFIKIHFFLSLFIVTAWYTAPLHALKILCITTSSPITAPFILNQITGLIDRGHDVYIHASKHEVDVSYPADLDKYNLVSKTFDTTFPKDFTVDVVMCQFGKSYEVYKTLQRRYNLQSKKVVTCLRDGHDVGAVIGTGPEIYEGLFEGSDLLLPVCDYFRNMLIAKGYSAQKIITVHSAIDCTKFSFRERTLKPNEPIHLVTVARLVNRKGIEYVIRAIALMQQKYPNLIYTIIGDGKLASELHHLAQTLGVEHMVRLVGKQSHEYVIRTLDIAHLFVLASITDETGNTEGIANALKESMAMGIPTVATDHAGTNELVTHGVSGFLVPEKNVVALADAIEYLINHTEIWPALAKAARDTVERAFEIEKENDKLVTILEMVCKQ
jgi:colanic acid/amylovoran biosynthesis glycosyltransferase